MIKDILVHVPTERPMRPVIDAATSLAAAFHAHLDAVSVGYVTSTTAYVMEGGAAVAAVFELERERAVERAEAALSVLEAEAKQAGLSFATHPIGGIPADAVETVGAMARLHDLCIALQPDSERSTFDNDLPQEMLFRSGGPVLFVPHIFKGVFRPRRIGLAWDGSRVASRAVRDCQPFLARAEDIVIIAVNDQNETSGVGSIRELLGHLARHGLKARIASVSATRGDIQPAILSLAADESIDLLVMGGYGHSRLQERVLGGVTRAMLQAMTVPTLMSH